MKRRNFLKAAALSMGSAAAKKGLGGAEEAGSGEASSSTNPPALSRREYGKTGIHLSIIGLGGIVVMNADQKHANAVVAEAVERGVNYFDVAPSYGNAEEILGPALEPHRKKVFLACKTGQRQREGAQAELECSLKRLRTDYLDLYQIHGIQDVVQDVDTVFSKGGAMETLIEAKKSRRVRFLGFSAHTVGAAVAAMDRFDFDSVLFPINFACSYREGFETEVVNKAKEKGVTLLALKALARQVWPKNDPDREKYGKCWYQPVSDPHAAELALKFTLSQPVTAAIPPGEEALFRLALDLAMQFRPIKPAEEEELTALAQALNPIFKAA